MMVHTSETVELEPHTAGLIDKRYVVQRVISANDFSAILAAYDEADEEMRALKVVELAAGRMFVELLNSYEALSSVDHPRVVRALRIVPIKSGAHTLVLEFVRGETLREWGKKNGTMPVWQLGDVLSQICEGMGAVHAAGWAHGDLKPGNIMLGEDGVKIIDFGSARALGRKDTTEFSGTPEFASPEQLRGEPLDERSDIFSLGATAFAMLTGKVPKRESPDAPAPSITRSSGTPFPPDAERIIKTMMAPDPDDRPSSMREVRTLLRSLDLQTLAFESAADADLGESPTVRGPHRELRPTPLQMKRSETRPLLLGTSHARGLTSLSAHPSGVVYVVDQRVLVFVGTDGSPRHVVPFDDGDVKDVALGAHVDVHVLTESDQIMVCDEELQVLSAVEVPGAAELSVGAGLWLVRFEDGFIRLTRSGYRDWWDELDVRASTIATAANGQWFAFARGNAVIVYRIRPNSYEEHGGYVFPDEVSHLSITDAGLVYAGLCTGEVCLAEDGEAVVRCVIPNLRGIGCQTDSARAISLNEGTLRHFQIE